MRSLQPRGLVVGPDLADSSQIGCGVHKDAETAAEQRLVSGGQYADHSETPSVVAGVRALLHLTVGAAPVGRADIG
ncbi:hypothetical protein ACFWJ4_33540 [Kitasatospora sp. NPDC127067]|uniref:hypothetical protein n=1 Tax=Kitasatospora sp. NPDC127067 TaxID=3347126 RepID=UPI003655DCBA